jgi:hypothetical protein
LPIDILLALAAVSATPVKDPSAVKVAAPEAASAKASVDPMQAAAAMTKMFDKFFPAGPEPDPARLAAAREATMTMFPKGAYAKAVSGFVNRTVDHVLNMSEADLAEMMPERKDKEAKGGEAKKAKTAKPPSTEPLRMTLARKEPNFDAKLAAIRAFADVMFVKFGDVAEPKFREGMARALARKFDARQLGEIQTFLATPTGAAYGREMVGLWFEPDVLRGTFQLVPDMMKVMPEMMKDAAALDAQLKDRKNGVGDTKTK